MPRLAPSLALFLILPLFACDAPEPIEQRSGTLPLAPGAMIIYAAGEAVDADDLVPLGPPASLGGTVLDGDPQLSARIDLADGSRLAGVFQATTGAVLIDFPFTEHATILAGQVSLTDEYGNNSSFPATAPTRQLTSKLHGRNRWDFPRPARGPPTASPRRCPPGLEKSWRRARRGRDGPHEVARAQRFNVARLPGTGAPLRSGVSISCAIPIAHGAVGRARRTTGRFPLTPGTT